MKHTQTQSQLGQFVHVIRVGDSVRIGLRSDQRKPSWYLVSVETHAIRRSLGTTDVDEAKRHALEFYQLYLKRGLKTAKEAYLGSATRSSQRRSFESVAHNWLNQEFRGVAYKKDVLRKFLLPFFAELRQVDDIAEVDQAMIQDYKHWRRSFWQRTNGAGGTNSVKVSEKQQASYGQPSATTINRELPVLRQILRFACERGFIDAENVPKVEPEKTKPKRRPAFRDDHFTVFLNEVDQGIRRASTVQERWRYELLRDWSQFARMTGLRAPHELDVLRWRHVDLTKQQVVIPEATKTGSRTVPLSEGACGVLKRLRDRRQRELGDGATLPADEPVFLLPDGSAYKSLSQLFRKVSDRCPYAAEGFRYTPYSLRHAFATEHVAAGAPLPVLSKAMGTQTRMLEQHYVHNHGLDLRPYLDKPESP